MISRHGHEHGITEYGNSPISKHANAAIYMHLLIIYAHLTHTNISNGLLFTLEETRLVK